MSRETSRGRRLPTPADVGLASGTHRGGRGRGAARGGQDLAVEVGDGMGLVASESAAGSLGAGRGMGDGMVFGWVGIRL